MIEYILENYYGEQEYPSIKTNPTILDWIRRFFPFAKDDSEISWCSIFLNIVCEELGLPRTNSPLARSWLNVGKPVTEPKIGDIVVFWRKSPDSWQGHVGIFIRRVGDKIYTLGGNQNNQVNISAYSAHRVLGYRRLL